MEKERVAQRNVTDVWEEKDTFDVIWIHFTLNEIQYEMVVERDKNQSYYPAEVFHEIGKNVENCPYCEKRYTVCLGFEQRDELFKQLIREPSIRLHWINRAHHFN